MMSLLSKWTTIHYLQMRYNLKKLARILEAYVNIILITAVYSLPRGCRRYFKMTYHPNWDKPQIFLKLIWKHRHVWKPWLIFHYSLIFLLYIWNEFHKILNFKIIWERCFATEVKITSFLYYFVSLPILEIFLENYILKCVCSK